MPFTDAEQKRFETVQHTITAALSELGYSVDAPMLHGIAVWLALNAIAQDKDPVEIILNAIINLANTENYTVTRTNVKSVQ